MKNKIAVFTNGFSNEFVEKVLVGLQEKASEDGIDIFTFITYCSPADVELQNKCQLNIFHLPDPADFDGAIMLTNTYNFPDEQERVCARFQRAKVPMLSLELEVPNMSCIRSENYQGVRELAIHLIEKHHAKRFLYFNGVAGNAENAIRRQALIDTLSEYGLELSGEIEGDFSFYGGYTNMQRFLTQGNPLPDAIVCANDHTALGVNSALIEAGYKVPDDVLLTGFDQSWEGRYTFPLLATVSRGWDDFGRIAYDKLMYQIKHPDERFNETYPSRFVPSESCGCEPAPEAVQYRISKIEGMYLNRVHNDLMDIFFQNLQIAIADAEQKEDFYEKALGRMGDPLLLGDNYCICTEPSFFELEDEAYPERIRGYSPEMDVLYERRDGKKLPLGSFPSKNLYPGYQHKEGESNLYLFVPLNHMDYIIGYVAIKNSPQLVYNMAMRSWTMSMNAVLFGMRRHIFAQKDNRELKKIYMTDALTGMYNRTGCEKVLYEFINKQKARGERSVLAFADIDRMKTINDVYGHLKGDLAIKATAEAFRKFSPGDWIFGRYGGDEFIAVGSCPNPRGIALEMQAISESMTEYFELLNLSFMLHASVGYAIIEPDDEGQVEDYIRRADESMYQEKEKMHKFMDSLL